MSRRHTVVQGECLSLIAQRHGFGDWRKLYDHPDNAELRRRRPNPNVLHPGDVVMIPDLQLKSASHASEQNHRFVVRLPRKVLRLVVCDREGTPLRGEPYELTFSNGPPIEGESTDADGKLEARAPRGADAATLKIAGRTFDLRLGHLNPLGDTPDGGLSGARARLANLGYGAGTGEGELDARTRSAIRWFQEDQGLEVTGELDAATIDRLRTVHGS